MGGEAAGGSGTRCHPLGVLGDTQSHQHRTRDRGGRGAGGSQRGSVGCGGSGMTLRAPPSRPPKGLGGVSQPRRSVHGIAKRLRQRIAMATGDRRGPPSPPRPGGTLQHRTGLPRAPPTPGGAQGRAAPGSPIIPPMHREHPWTPPGGGSAVWGDPQGGGSALGDPPTVRSVPGEDLRPPHPGI